MVIYLKHLKILFNGLVTMMGMQQMGDMLFGHLILFGILIIFGMTVQKERTCSTAVLLPHGDVLVLFI